jgi:ubiquitin thioesterase protein OTUB1
MWRIDFISSGIYTYISSLIALAFAYVERVLEAEDRDLALGSAMSILEPSQSILEAVGFQRLVFEDFYEAFASLIHRVAIPDGEGKLLNPGSLLGAFQNVESRS